MSGYALGQPLSVGEPDQLVIIGASPGNNANFVQKIDSFWVWQLRSAVFTVTTDANVANRLVTLEYAQDSGASYAVAEAAVVQTAGGTQRYVGSVTQGVGEWNTGTDVLFHLPDVLIYGGSTVTITIGSIQAGDNITKIRLTFNRWRTGPDETDYAGA